MAVYIFKMADGSHPEFHRKKNLTSVEVTGDCHTEFGKDISKGGRVMAISRTNEPTNQQTNSRDRNIFLRMSQSCFFFLFACDSCLLLSALES